MIAIVQNSQASLTHIPITSNIAYKDPVIGKIMVGSQKESSFELYCISYCTR